MHAVVFDGPLVVLASDMKETVGNGVFHGSQTIADYHDTGQKMQEQTARHKFVLIS
jgi:hypothetical protein